jgi:hypothetical protein
MGTMPPKVYVHKDVNPPGNAKEFLQTHDVVLWEADLGQGPAHYQYDPKTGNYMPLTPAQVQELMPPEALPEVQAAPVAPALGAPPSVGAGTTRPSIEGHTAKAAREGERAGREREMREVQAVGNLQKRSAGEGVMGQLSMPERAAATKLMQEGNISEAEAVQAVVAKRTAGAQAGALEAQP